MNFIKKALLSLIASLVLFQSLAIYAPAQAQTNQWYDSDIYTWYIKVYDTQTSQPQEIFGERYTAAQVQWVVYSLITVIMNMAFGSEFTACIMYSRQDGSTSVDDIKGCWALSTVINAFKGIRDWILGGVIEPSNLAAQPEGFFGMVFDNRKVSGINYIKNISNRFNIGPTEVAAQDGFGYGALDLLQPLWQKSRDIAYGLLIFVAIIMAFMIMLRTKISPQAVITVQSAIPKLVGAIVLITFSYAIAGLMIDLMYIVIGIAASVLAPDPDSVAIVYKTMTDGPNGMGLFGIMMVYSTLFPYFLMGVLFGGGGAFGIILGNQLLGWLIFILLAIVVIVLIFAFLKVFFMLVRTLVSIYLSVIFSPFYILGGAISGSLGFGQWLKDLAANLMVFPAIGILFMFSLTFLAASIGPVVANFPDELIGYINEIMVRLLGTTLDIVPVGSNGWAPPFLGLGDNSGGLMLLLTSLGILLLMPKVADIIKGFMSGRPFAYGSAIGEAVSGAAAGVSAGARGTQWLGTRFRQRTNTVSTPSPKSSS